MENKILFVGLDVDDNAMNGYSIVEGALEGTWFKSRPTVKHVMRFLEPFANEGYTIHLCYEATYLGYTLCREFRNSGIECTIVAPGSIPKPANDRVKNDRIDAKNLAILFMKGMLTAVYVPTEEDEQVRGLLRSRDFINQQFGDLRRYIISLCKQLGWNYRQEINKPKACYWTDAHVQWLGTKVNGSTEAITLNFSILQNQMSQLQARLEEIESHLMKYSQTERYAQKISSLQAYRGLDTIAAMTIVLEVGDIKRFSHPKKLASYTGLDIKEYSSGGKERRYSITKMGNGRLRRILTEANQCAGKKPNISKALKKRRENLNPDLVAVADRCMERLYKKAAGMHFRSKPTNKIKTACAREMLGFIWESLNKVS